MIETSTLSKPAQNTVVNGDGDIISHLQNIVDSSELYEAAELALTHLSAPADLIRCAEMVGKREPGGAFYRAKLWVRAETLRAASDGGFPRQTLGLLCIEANVHLPSAKSYIAQGRIVEEAESESRAAAAAGRAFVDSALLREIPPMVLQNALNQKERGAEYLMQAAAVLQDEPRSTAVQIHNQWCRDNGSVKANLDIIKPSDWWAFSHPKWRREEDFAGSIPGEVYANALYYFAPQRGVAVDSMAGSGMLKRVYEDRARWQKDSNFKLDIRLFDLHPHKEFIVQHDACQPLSLKADWIFIDPPYFGQSDHLFEGDLAAATDYAHYQSLLEKIICASAASLNAGGRLCLFLPKWSGQRPSDPNYDVPADASASAIRANLRWIDAAFVSRGRQQESGSAMKNNSAKRHRRMRSDTCVLNVFEKPEEPHV